MKSIETILVFIFRTVFAEELFVIGVRGRAKSFVRFPACPETEHDGAKRMQGNTFSVRIAKRSSKLRTPLIFTVI